MAGSQGQGQRFSPRRSQFPRNQRPPFQPTHRNYYNAPRNRQQASQSAGQTQHPAREPSQLSPLVKFSKPPPVQPSSSSRPVQAVRPQIHPQPPSKQLPSTDRQPPTSAARQRQRPPSPIFSVSQTSTRPSRRSQSSSGQTSVLRSNVVPEPVLSLVSEYYSDDHPTRFPTPVIVSPDARSPLPFQRISGILSQTYSQPASTVVIPKHSQPPPPVYSQPPPALPSQFTRAPPPTYDPASLSQYSQLPQPTSAVRNFSLPPPPINALPSHSQILTTASLQAARANSLPSSSLPQPPLPEEPPPLQPPPPISPPPTPTVMLPHHMRMWLGPGSYRPEWVTAPPTVLFTAAPPPHFDAYRPRFRFLRPSHPHACRYPIRMGMLRGEGPLEIAKKKAIKRKSESQENDDDSSVIHEKRKKSMSKFYPAKQWNQDDATKALAAEKEVSRKDSKTLVVKFPELDITREIVANIHPAIEKVHFQVPGTARYCFIKVKEGEDTDAVMEELNKTDFLNMGCLKVEPKPERDPTEDPDHCETIDPYTLYLGNLPLNINTTIVKEKFPTASRIDIGFAQRMKFTRYAFIRYQTVEDAIDAFHSATKMSFDSRTLIVRFRRQKAERAQPQPPEQKLSKKLRKQRKKLLAEKEELEEMKLMVASKIKGEPSDDKKTVNGIADVLKTDDLFDDGRLSENEDDEEEEDVIDEDSDDSDEESSGAAPIRSFLNPKPVSDDDDDDDDDDDEDDDDDDDEDEERDNVRDRLVGPALLPVKKEKIKVEENIKKENDEEPPTFRRAEPDDEDSEEEEDDDDDDDDSDD